MSTMSDPTLSDKESLFMFLLALVKRNGGYVIITEEEIKSIAKEDSVVLRYDKENGIFTFEAKGAEPTVIH